MDASIDVPVTILTFIIGSLIPLLVAVVTKASASAGFKAIMNLVLSILLGVGTYLLQNDGKAKVIDIVAVIIAMFLTGNVTYRAFWKPTEISTGLARSTAEFGIGA